MRRDVFQAIADPTRREILQLLAGKSLSLNAVAENFNISRPAISKQIKILHECGLIKVVQKGRERICAAKPEKLNEVIGWIDKYHLFWNKKMDSLEAHLKRNQEKSSRPRKST